MAGFGAEPQPSFLRQTPAIRCPDDQHIPPLPGHLGRPRPVPGDGRRLHDLGRRRRVPHGPHRHLGRQGRRPHHRRPPASSRNCSASSPALGQTLPPGQESRPPSAARSPTRSWAGWSPRPPSPSNWKTCGSSRPDDAVREAVLDMPTFKGTDGKFDRQVFEAVLRNNGLNEPRFLDMVREPARGAAIAGRGRRRPPPPPTRWSSRCSCAIREALGRPGRLPVRRRPRAASRRTKPCCSAGTTTIRTSTARRNTAASRRSCCRRRRWPRTSRSPTTTCAPPTSSTGRSM